MTARSIQEELIFKALEKLEKHGSTGFLELKHPDGSETITVYLFDGLIEAASSNLEPFRLGQYALRAGHLVENGLANLLQRAERERTRLGQLLVESRAVSESELQELLTEQLASALERAVGAGYGVTKFTGTTETAMRYRLAFSAFHAALEVARRRPRRLRLLPEQGLELNLQGEGPGGHWRPEEIAVMSELRYPVTVQDLLERSTLQENEILGVLQILTDLGMLRVGERVPPRETALMRPERMPLENLIPRVPKINLDQRVEMINQEYSPVTEQFRALKVRLQNQTDPPVRILCVTSPMPQDGKSLVATDLAWSFSREPGRRTLLIDADLRGPTVHEKLGIPREPGLVQYLLGRLDPQCYIRRAGDLYVLTSGATREDAVELLSLGRMRDLLRFAGREFDTVIVDTPPVLPIADARILCQLAEATVLVIRQGRTPYRLVERALESLDRRKLLGVILNGVRTTGIDGYYQYSYYYAYPYTSSQPKDGVIELKARPRGPGRRSSTSIVPQ